MNYYIRERKLEAGRRTAWSKARGDAERICAGEGFVPIDVEPAASDRVNADLMGKLRGHREANRVWQQALAELGAGDTLFLQVPVIHNAWALAGLLAQARGRGARVLGLVHDLETLRMGLDGNVGLRSRLRMQLEESGVLKQCDRLIVHNENMRERMAAAGTPREKLICLGIFDYLTEASAPGSGAGRDRLVAAGNLAPEKAGYLYALPEDIPLELYGVNYRDDGGANRHYHGAFDPEELPGVLEGGFGLVWDGPSPDTCAGVYGAYLRYNNPHKTSLYLAAGLPVAIWEEAALADLITAEGAGFTAASVRQAAEKAAAMTAAEYETVRRSAVRLGQKLRRGDFLRRALGEGMESE